MPTKQAGGGPGVYQLSVTLLDPDHVAKLTEPKELGVDRFNVYLMHDAMNETLDAYGEGSVPRLSSG